MKKEELITLATNLHFKMELDRSAEINEFSSASYKPFIRFRHSAAPDDKEYACVIFVNQFDNDRECYDLLEAAIRLSGRYEVQKQLKRLLGGIV